MLFLPNRFHTVKLNTDKNRVRALRLFVGSCAPVFKGGCCCGLGKPPSLDSRLMKTQNMTSPGDQSD